MPGFFDFLDSLFDNIEGSGDGQRPRASSARALMALLGLALVIFVLGLAFAPNKDTPASAAIANSSTLQNEGGDTTSPQISDQDAWKMLTQDMTTCSTEHSGALLDSAEMRTLALFASAKFNCPDVAAMLIAQGVKLDEKRFVNGKVLGLEQFAQEFNSVAVKELIVQERIRRDAEMKKIALELEQAKVASVKKVQDLERQRHQNLEAVMSEQLELRKSIHYDRARLDCEALRERLGYSAQLLDMVDCIKKGIELRRNERSERGHHVPP